MRHIVPPRVRGRLPARLASLFFGLFVCALGLAMILRADLGLSPWDTLHQGITLHTPLTFGVVNTLVGLAVLLIAWSLGERPGFGTLANATMIGAYLELLLRTHALPELTGGNVGVRVCVVLAGVLLFGVGTAFYIGAGLGAGPRDSLMLAVWRRTGLRIALARAATELTALGIGVSLGGKLGFGTAAFAFGVGPAMELSFFLLGRSRLALEGAPATATAP